MSHDFGQSGHSDGSQRRQRGQEKLSVLHVERGQQVQPGELRAHLMLSVHARQNDGQVQLGEKGGDCLQGGGAGHRLDPTSMLTCNNMVEQLKKERHATVDVMAGNSRKPHRNSIPW